MVIYYGTLTWYCCLLSMDCGTFWTTSCFSGRIAEVFAFVVILIFFTWFMVEFWMYIHGQHNRLFDNVGVEFQHVKCNFFIIIMFWIWNNREQAEIVFIYLLFFQNINMVHKFFYTISLLSLDCLFSIFINLRV